MAENERVFTTVFKADISDFGSSAQELNRYVKQVNSEFAEATACMGKWSDSTDGLKAKITQLNGILQAEQIKLDASKQKYAELVAQGKENTAQAQKLATEINNQSAKVKGIQSDIEHYTASLKELDDAGAKTREELEKINKTADEQKQAFKELADGAGKVAVAGLAGIATACVGAIAGLNSLVNDTKELRTQMGQLETAFTTAGHSADSATKTYSDLNAVLGDSGKATEASMHLAQLAKDEQELDKYTNILTGVYATFGDSLPVEGLAEAMNHTAKLGSVQGNLADALEWSGINVDDFNAQLEQCNSEEERAQLISSTLNGIYGESAKKYKEVNKEVIEANKAQDDYNQAMADIAEVAQPVITEFKTVMVDVLQKILEKFKEVDIEGLIKKISDAIKSLTDKVLPVVIDLITWIIDNMEWLAPLLGTVAVAIGAVTAGIKAYEIATKAAKTAQLLFNAAMTANPIGLVIAAIAALIAVIVLCVKHWDDIKAAASKAWDGIKAVWEKVSSWFKEKVVEPIKKFFSELWDGIKDAGSKALDGVKSAWNSVSSWFNDKVIKPVGEFFKKMWDGIKNAASTAVNGVKSVWQSVSSWLNTSIISPVTNAFSNMWSKLKSGASSAWDGVKSVFSKVGSFFSDTFSKAWNGVKNIFSTGGKVFDGIKDGISTAFKNIVNGLIGGINKVVAVPFNGINAALRKVRDIEIAGLAPFKGKISEINVPQIPKLATGGVVDKPTLAMIGEAGKEVVMPIEKNTAWINELAKQIKGANGGQNVTVTQNFAGMRTTALEAHKARIELMRALKFGGV